MRVGIVGYGNLGRALRREIEKSEHSLVGVFTSHKEYTDGIKVYDRAHIYEYKEHIDTLLIATSSLKNAESDTRELLRSFNTVDSFDIHKRIMQRKNDLDGIGKSSGKVAIISAGWDPGILSLIRAIGSISIRSENINTFWGCGKSLGHTSALKQIRGVKNAVQYTVPIESSISKAKNADAHLDDTERHKRICYIVVEKNADKEKIKSDILSLEDYFLGYDTEIHFVSDDELCLKDNSNGHCGEVIATEKIESINASLDAKITMSSNPAFTARIMISYLNAINYLQKEHKFGAFTPIDIPLSMLISDDIISRIV